MRATVLTGLFACVVIAAASSSTASAEAQNKSIPNSFLGTPFKVSLLSSTNMKTRETTPVKPVEAKAQPKVHEVKPDESLSAIAAQYETDWYRIYNKNEQLSHPDVLAVGDKITIPTPNEQLKDRPLPQPPVVAETTPVAEYGELSESAVSQPTYRNYSRGSSAGNTYTAGYCTWYAKNMRPDLPNNLGNADTWVARAAAQGLPTGSTPQVGAIGQQGMHVVYVESVNGDGTVTISEMNYRGLYVVSTRTVAASNFQYIY